MFNYLEQLDHKLIVAINGLHSPMLDEVMWVISEKYFGIPFYLLFIYLIFKKFNWPGMILPVLFSSVSVALGDLISNNLFKKVFERYRPSHNLDLMNQLHYVNDYHGGQYGFVSSHSANMFALATMIFLLLRKQYKYAWLVFIWSALIAYSRVYLGVHYPSDIIVGGLLGIAISIILFLLLKRLNAMKKYNL